MEGKAQNQRSGRVRFALDDRGLPYAVKGGEIPRAAGKEAERKVLCLPLTHSGMRQDFRLYEYIY